MAFEHVKKKSSVHVSESNLIERNIAPGSKGRWCKSGLNLEIA